MNARTIGSIHHATAEKLAVAALEAMGRKYAYSVAIDWKGVVYIDLPNDTPVGDIVMTCRRGSDPDELTENIRDEMNRRARELKQRNPKCPSKTTSS